MRSDSTRNPLFLVSNAGHGLGRSARAQEVPLEISRVEKPADPGQHPDEPTPFFGSRDQEHELDRTLVQRVEVDGPDQAAQRQGEPGGPRALGVGNGDSPPMPVLMTRSRCWMSATMREASVTAPASTSASTKASMTASLVDAATSSRTHDSSRISVSRVVPFE